MLRSYGSTYARRPGRKLLVAAVVWDAEIDGFISRRMARLKTNSDYWVWGSMLVSVLYGIYKAIYCDTNINRKTVVLQSLICRSRNMPIYYL